MGDDDRSNLLRMPRARARAAVASGAPVFLFVNPVEYHGPHLPLHNDAIVSFGLARDIHARLAERERGLPLLCAGDLEIGVGPTFGPGTRRTPFPVARRLVREACRALAELGAKRVVILTFHGDPLHNLAIQAGIELLERAGVRAVAPFNAALRELVALDGERYAEAFAGIDDAAERRAMIEGMALDFHAGFLETSMTLHYAPESVSAVFRSLPPCPAFEPDAALLALSRMARALGRARLARELTFAAWGRGWQSLDPFPGYTGRPHRASAAAGAVFARRFVDVGTALAEDVFAGRARSPEPILGWIAAATLGGRLAPAPSPRAMMPTPADDGSGARRAARPHAEVAAAE